ncbi:MAG: FAD-binding oxidoreductase [Leptospiraceae bacterium]|nr:FAD-binding oxidoreductase [Leptospiraceae bacterium]
MKDKLITALQEEEIPLVLDSEELRVLGQDRTRTAAGMPLALAEPRSVEEVQKIIVQCRRHKVSVVPQGGRTGYAGAACSAGHDLLLSMRRMNQILHLDPYLPALTVQAGCITQTVQQFALDNGYYFPVDFASSGSSQIGGNAATNAGGIRFIRYGGMRKHILGLKAVLGNGELLETNGQVLKDNTGYSLKDLLIGSEGTLGIICELTLSLTSPPPDSLVLLCGMESVERILELLALARKSGIDLHAFEFFDHRCLAAVREYNDLEHPFSETHDWYCLLEFTATEAERFLELPELFSITTEALPAQNESSKKRFWSFRENISESLSHGPVHKNDISIPLSRIPNYIAELKMMLEAPAFHAWQLFLFGHIGDGNVHINLKPGTNSNETAFHQICHEFDRLNTQLISKYNGSISAEHGIGTLKKESFQQSSPESTVQIMRKIKLALDPDGILNPGKIFDS